MLLWYAKVSRCFSAPGNFYFVLLYYDRRLCFEPFGGALHTHSQESACLLSCVLLHLGRDVQGILRKIAQADPTGFRKPGTYHPGGLHYFVRVAILKGFEKIL